MPNHVHGIIKIVGATPRACPTLQGQPQGVAPTGLSFLSLPDVVHRFKTMTTKRYTDGVKQNDRQPYPAKLWQRNYYEYIICDDKAYFKSRNTYGPVQSDGKRMSIMFKFNDPAPAVSALNKFMPRASAETPNQGGEAVIPTDRLLT